MRPSKSRARTSSATGTRQRQQKQAVEMIMRGLDALASQAEAAEIGTASRILYTAKEELVHWAVTMNFHESAQDRFINRRLYDNRLSTVEALIIRGLKSAGKSNELLRLLGIPAAKPISLAARK